MLAVSHVTRQQERAGSGYFEGFSKLLYVRAPQLDYESFAIYFENVKRLPKTLAYIERLYGPDAKLYIAGEISKRYERRYHGRVDELRNYLGLPADAAPKEKLAGEVSFLIYPKHTELAHKQKTEFDADPLQIASILNDEIEASTKQLAVIMTKLLGISKNEATKHLIAVKHSQKA